MGDGIDFRVLELLCGRLCHELVSPIGAINNGVELLDEEDPDFVKEAMGLIGQSARKAGQRLQFYRFAYGTAGSGSASGGGSAPDGRELSAGLLEGGKIRAEWSAEASALSPAWQRLACNMLILAADALPRGGTVHVRARGDGLEVAADGDFVSLPAEIRTALAGPIAADALTARTIHAFYTLRLAEHLSARLAVSAPGQGRVLFSAAAADRAPSG